MPLSVFLALSHRLETVSTVLCTTGFSWMLSGLTWPRYAMNQLWLWLGNLVPATWGVNGFVAINNNGSTLALQQTNYLALWVLVAVYFVCAVLAERHAERTPVKPLYA